MCVRCVVDLLAHACDTFICSVRLAVADGDLASLVIKYYYFYFNTSYYHA